jgi:hypothetical protein
MCYLHFWSQRYAKQAMGKMQAAYHTVDSEDGGSILLRKVKKKIFYRTKQRDIPKESTVKSH